MEIYIKPPILALSGIKAVFTTKNLLDNSNRIDEALAADLEIDKGSIYLPVQKHTNIIQILEDNPETVIADAVVTDRKNVYIGVITADCVPVLLYDREREIIGAVHAGWRGTSNQILKHTITKIQEKFGCLLGDVLIAIGPSIRQCSYEVGEEVITEVRKATGDGDYYNIKGGRYFIDLSSANKIQALHAGIPAENIWQSQECTFCSPDRFYSYRYSKGVKGRQGGFIGMW